MSDADPHIFDEEQTAKLIAAMLELKFVKWHKQLEADPRLHDAYTLEAQGIAVLIRKSSDHCFRIEASLDVLEQIKAHIPNLI